MVSPLRSAYHRLIADHNREIPFWVMMTFLPTFIIARIVVYVGVPIFVFVRGTHIHHLTYGIILLAITGYLALTVQKPRRRLWVAGLYGVGLALAFDEFGMWLSLRDDYWVRWSYDVVLTIIALLINAVYFSDFWLRVLKQLKGRVQRDRTDLGSRAQR